METIVKFFKQLRQNRTIRRAYGTALPDMARVLGGSHPICVDPTDQRARKILLFDTLRGRNRTNQTFWFLANRVYQPTLCLDIGLNYGECLLAGRSPKDAELHGFEANPRLRPFIEKTLRDHPEQERVQIHFGAVSDASDQKVILAVDPKWSGGSHIAGSGCAIGAGELALEIETLTIDQTVPRPTAGSRLLFKIDVEGHEAAALRGMEKTIAAAGSAIGFIEFNQDLLAERGTDLASFWKELRQHFDIFFCNGQQRALPITGSRWADARSAIPGNSDLILMSRPQSALQQQFLADWQAFSRRGRKAA